MGNVKWAKLFPNGNVTHGSIAYFDHLRVILSTKGNSQSQSNGHKPFRFESLWVGNMECLDIIKHMWCSPNEAVLGYNIMDCIQRCGERLRI